MLIVKNHRLRRELIQSGAVRPGQTPVEKMRELEAKGFSIAARAIRTVPLRRRLSTRYVPEVN